MSLAAGRRELETAIALHAGCKHFGLGFARRGRAGRFELDSDIPLSEVYLLNHSKRYATSGPAFPSYASWATTRAKGSVYRAMLRGPQSSGSKPVSRISTAAVFFAF